MMTAIQGDRLPVMEIIDLSETSSDPLVQKMLENFLAFRGQKVGKLPESSVSQIDAIRQTPPDKPGVYIVQVDDAYKIGHTVNFAKRIPKLKTGNPKEMVLINFIETANRLQAKRLESALHAFFWQKLIRGEWYKLNEADLKFIEDYQAGEGQRPVRDKDTLDTQIFIRMQEEIITTSIRKVCQILKKRTFMVEDILRECQDAGLTYASWVGALCILDRDKKLYFSNGFIRVPRDFLNDE